MNNLGKAVFAVLCAATGLCAASLLSGCANSRNTNTSSSRSTSGSLMVTMESGTYMIKPGDAVELSVLGYDEFRTSTTVKESGSIIVPVLGEIHAAGLSKQQLADTIRKRLVEFVKGEPEITLGISSPSNARISVLGAVTRQDNYPVTGEITLMEALSGAGGTTPESDLTRIRIIRKGNTSDYVDVDLSSSLETGNLESIPKVQSGDVVYVPKKENVVRTFSDFLRDAVFLFGSFRLFY